MILNRGLLQSWVFGVAAFLAVAYFVGLADHTFQGLAPESSFSYLGALAESSWFQIVCVAALFFALGLSLDGLLEHYSDKGVQEIKELGRNAMWLGATIRQNREGQQDDAAILERFGPRIGSAMVGLGKIGLPMLPVPEERLDASTLTQLVDYLRGVGQLIQDGHFQEANLLAHQLASEMAPQEQEDLDEWGDDETPGTHQTRSLLRPTSQSA